MRYARKALSNPKTADIPGESRAQYVEYPNAKIRHAAVSVLFTTKNDVPTMLLIKRAAHTGNHRTEWAFPGGVVEPNDESLLYTALRETEEELGIHPSSIKYWGALPKVVTGTGYEVWPFAGELHQNTQLTPSPREVDDFVFAPVANLMDISAHRQITLIRDDNSRKWDAIAYEGRIIWGATARIIQRTLSIIYPERSLKSR